MVASEIFKYEKSDPGPYKVNICYLEDRDVFIDTMAVGQDLTKNGYTDYKPVKRVSKKVATVTFDSFRSANKVIDDTVLKKKYKIYILRNFIYSDGFIKIDPTSVEWEGEFGVIDQIKKENPNVSEVKRIKYKTKDANGKETENFSYKTSITFRTRKIPDDIRVFRCIKKVFPFINKVRFCDNCGFYGHLKVKCNRNEEYCVNCFEKGHKTCAKTFCKHCKKADHATNDNTCPEKKRQEKISKIMAVNNIGFNEAKKFAKQDLNPYAQLEDLKQFPQLPKPQQVGKLKQTFNFSNQFSPKAQTTPNPDNRGSKRRLPKSSPNWFQSNPYYEKPIDPLSMPSQPLNFSNLVKVEDFIDHQDLFAKFAEKIRKFVCEELKNLKKTLTDEMDYQSAEENAEVKSPPVKKTTNELLKPGKLNHNPVNSPLK